MPPDRWCLMSSRRKQCIALARIIHQCTDESRHDEAKAARFFALAQEYEAEAALIR